MKRILYIFTLLSLLIGLTVILGCNGIQEGSSGNSSKAESQEESDGNSPEIEGFSTVVEMNGKELTVGAPTFSGGGDTYHHEIVTVLVKNTGLASIHVAELEILIWNPPDDDYYQRSVVAEDLAPGDVQALYWVTSGLFWGSIKVKVVSLE